MPRTDLLEPAVWLAATPYKLAHGASSTGTGLVPIVRLTYSAAAPLHRQFGLEAFDITEDPGDGGRATVALEEPKAIGVRRVLHPPYPSSSLASSLGR